MEIKITWSNFSKFKLLEIFKYYKENVSTKVAKDLVKNLTLEPNVLIKAPYIGQIEPLLSERNIVYRYIIFKSYKILYSVDEENSIIKIHDVFDTRQKPVKILRKK